MSTTVLFALCILSVCARYYIRLAVQKEFKLDDAFVAVGTSCLVAGMVILYINMDNLYFVEAITRAPDRFTFHPQDLNRVLIFHKLVIQVGILTWVAMVTVKFAFLALFWRLIDRIPSLIKYWWVVVAFNLAATGYGISVYLFKCVGGMIVNKTQQLDAKRVSLPATLTDAQSLVFAKMCNEKLSDTHCH